MTSLRFFEGRAPLALAEIARLTDAHLPEGVDGTREVSGAAPLDLAGGTDITFFDHIRFSSALARTRAAACFCSARYAGLVPAGTVALVVAHPHRAFAQTAARLYPEATRPTPITATAGVSPAAHVDPAARLETGVTVEPGAVIGPGAEIGSASLIGPGAVIGPGVRIGRGTVIAAQVTITNALIGDRVILHPGVRIGQDGFGYIPGNTGHLKVAQVGRVIIQDDVEIGANTTIDRGSNRDTVIGEGTKIDNQVQVGHNVIIGRHCLIAGQAGISGSVTIGDFVMLGGHAGIRDNVTIGNGAQIAAAAGVHTDVPAGEKWVGAPAGPMAGWLREFKALKRLARVRGEANGSAKGGADG